MVEIREIPVEKIRPNPRQPRRVFDEEKLRELAESIEKVGLIHPILVRPKGNCYELVHGERRFRACKIAGLTTIPSEVRDLSDRESLEVSLSENLQREDINPIEEAGGLRVMIDEFGYTQAKLAKRIGKSRPYVANSLRLLKMDSFLKECVLHKTFSVWHARTIEGLGEEFMKYAVADLVMDWNLSVDETRRIVRDANEGKPAVCWVRVVPIRALREDEEANRIADSFGDIDPYERGGLTQSAWADFIDAHIWLKKKGGVKGISLFKFEDEDPQPIVVDPCGVILWGYRRVRMAKDLTDKKLMEARIVYFTEWLKRGDRKIVWVNPPDLKDNLAGALKNGGKS